MYNAPERMRSAPATESAGVIAGRIGRPSANALFVPAYVLTNDDQQFTDTENGHTVP